MSPPELAIRGLRLPVRLGCPADERLNAQPVEIDISIRFDPPPKAMVTDRLEDTVCYSVLVEAVKAVVADREFALVEHLAHEIFTSLRRIVEPPHKLRLRVLKVSPPIPELTRGAEFSMGD